MRRFTNKNHPVRVNCDRGRSKEISLENDWEVQRVDDEQLYDLVFDPLENNNVAHCSRHRNVLVKLRERLDTWMHDTEDPLLRGPIEAPDGAVMRLVDSEKTGGYGEGETLVQAKPD